jgi:tetratricopeptide (TPR) repeat protein
LAGILLAFLAAGCAEKRPPTPVRLSPEHPAQSPESVIMRATPAIAAGQAGANVYQERGEAYYRLGQYELAQKDFEHARAAGGGAQAAYDLGAAAYMNQDYQKAVNYFSDAIAKDATMAKAYNNRGVAALALGQYDKAGADFSAAAGLGGQAAAASLFNRALAYQAQNEFDRALADYDRVISLDPSQTAARNNKADIFIALRRYDAAAAELDAAIGLNPGDPDLFYNRALVREKLGNYPQAMEDYDRAAKLRSNFGQAYRNRGVLRLRLQMTREGCGDLSLACQFGYCGHLEKAKNFGLCQ